MRGAVVLACCPCDGEWVACLRQHLRAHRDRAPSTWAREDVRAGERTREATQAAFVATPAALLLVSPRFIADEMSPGGELYPHVLATAARGAPVLWIPLSYSAYRSTEIRGYQALHDPERPLDGLAPAALHRALVEICERLLTTLADQGTTRSSAESDSLAQWMAERLSEAEIRQVLAANHPRGAALLAFLPPRGSPRDEVATTAVRFFAAAGCLPALRQTLQGLSPTLPVGAPSGARGVGKPSANWIEELIEGLLASWPGDGAAALAAALGLTDAIAVAVDASPAARMHLVLLALCERGDASGLRALADLGETCRRAHDLADALEQGRWPSGLERCWLSVQARGSGAWRVAWHVAGASGGAQQLRTAVTIEVADADATIELRPGEAGLSLKIVGPRSSGLVGAAARLWTGLRGIRRRLFPEASDRLGPEEVSCLAEFTVGNEEG